VPVAFPLASLNSKFGSAVRKDQRMVSQSKPAFGFAYRRRSFQCCTANGGLSHFALRVFQRVLRFCLRPNFDIGAPAPQLRRVRLSVPQPHANARGPIGKRALPLRPSQGAAAVTSLAPQHRVAASPSQHLARRAKAAWPPLRLRLAAEATHWPGRSPSAPQFPSDKDRMFHSGPDQMIGLVQHRSISDRPPWGGSVFRPVIS